MHVHEGVVLIALLSLSRYHLGRHQILANVRQIKSDPPVEIVFVDQRTDDEARHPLESRPDKD
ncbi:MAG: hypothetical protein ACHQ4H_18160 [Ktedonobacterales bacterium]